MPNLFSHAVRMCSRVPISIHLLHLSPSATLYLTRFMGLGNWLYTAFSRKFNLVDSILLISHYIVFCFFTSSYVVHRSCCDCDIACGCLGSSSSLLTSSITIFLLRSCVSHENQTYFFHPSPCYRYDTPPTSSVISNLNIASLISLLTTHLRPADRFC